MYLCQLIVLQSICVCVCVKKKWCFREIFSWVLHDLYVDVLCWTALWHFPVVVWGFPLFL